MRVRLQPRPERTVIDDTSRGLPGRGGRRERRRRPDVIAVGGDTCAWYENPTWKKRIVSTGKQTPGIISSATADLDGDGKAEIAIAYEFEMSRPTIGKLLWPQGKGPDEPWTLIPIADVDSIHRLRWGTSTATSGSTWWSPRSSAATPGPGLASPAHLRVFSPGTTPNAGSRPGSRGDRPRDPRHRGHRRQWRRRLRHPDGVQRGRGPIPRRVERPLSLTTGAPGMASETRVERGPSRPVHGRRPVPRHHRALARERGRRSATAMAPPRGGDRRTGRSARAADRDRQHARGWPRALGGRCRWRRRRRDLRRTSGQGTSVSLYEFDRARKAWTRTVLDRGDRRTGPPGRRPRRRRHARRRGHRRHHAQRRLVSLPPAVSSNSVDPAALTRTGNWARPSSLETPPPGGGIFTDRMHLGDSSPE